ncbi:hypothetical protein SUGI_0955950 [Cryptomeria japonica]|nr:hypothetical protein SUGI_0955950 [Cryptomeria japonica]
MLASQSGFWNYWTLCSNQSFIGDGKPYFWICRAAEMRILNLLLFLRGCSESFRKLCNETIPAEVLSIYLCCWFQCSTCQFTT